VILPVIHRSADPGKWAFWGFTVQKILERGPCGDSLLSRFKRVRLPVIRHQQILKSEPLGNSPLSRSLTVNHSADQGSKPFFDSPLSRSWRVSLYSLLFSIYKAANQ